MEKEQMIDLVKKSKNGDPVAIEELLRAAHTPVSYQCRKLLKNEQDAEDVTQEVLLTLYTKLDTLMEPAAFWGWLSRITANRCMNALSRTHVDLQILEDEEGHSMLDDIENTDQQLVPDAALDNAETARMIDEIIEGLPEAQRMCTLFFYFDEMSVKEISSVMGTSENTVKSRLNYARKAIKERVLDYEKSGVKLYGMSPIPFLFFFLRRAAENSAEGTAAQKMAARVMAEGAAVIGQDSIAVSELSSTVLKNTQEKLSTKTSRTGLAGQDERIEAGMSETTSAGMDFSSASTASIAGGSGTAGVSAASAATGAALKGISLKMIAGFAAGLIAVGGIGVGIYSVVDHGNEQDAASNIGMVQESVVAEEDTELQEESEIFAETIPEETENLVSDEILAGLPYTGDISQCKMSVEQAEAFASILQECIEDSADKGTWNGDTLAPAFCRAALFDAGGGCPALWVVEGANMRYEYNPESGFIPAVSKIYCWDGSQVVESMNYTSGEAMNHILTKDGVLVDRLPSGTSPLDYAELYTMSDGRLSDEPAHVYELFCMPIEDGIPTEEKVRAYAEQYGHYASYDYSTLSNDKWEDVSQLEELSEYYDGEGWLIVALDGKFESYTVTRNRGEAYIHPAVTWELGQGANGARDVSNTWKGEWADAEAILECLLSVSSETSEEGSDVMVQTEQSGDVQTVKTDIQRYTIDVEDYNAEVYYEYPVFSEAGAGYQRINEFFQEQLKEFINSEDTEWAVDEVIKGSDPDLRGKYSYTVSCTIHTKADQIISLSQTMLQRLGGNYGRVTYYNFRTDTGERLYLDDLISGTEEEIRQMVIDALNEAYPEMAEYFPDGIEKLRNYSMENFNCYLSDGKVHVYFNEGDIAPEYVVFCDVELSAEPRIR